LFKTANLQLIEEESVNNNCVLNDMSLGWLC